jgi:transcriptional regulator EpsA
MDALVTLTAVDLERLLITIESSQQVHLRHQYFLWSQGVLQSFLPHEALIVGYGEYGTPSFRYEVLGRTQLAGDRLPGSDFDKLVGLALDSWQHGGHVPKAFGGDGNGNGICPVGQLLRRFSIGHAMAHGAREFTGDSSGFFVFLNMPEAPGRRHVYFAQMLMPYLHTTLHRMLTQEKNAPELPVRFNTRLSGREAQVISLVRDGMTNQQIAGALELSPLTIKNHIQNILRKLEVSNRAQAVAKAVKARLISDQPGT